MDKLPLDDPRWWPMWNAIELRKVQTGDQDLGVKDLEQAMARGKLHGMRRSRDNGEREHLSPPFEKLFVWFYSCGIDEVDVRREAANYPLDDWVFYVWKPDFDQLFLTGAPAEHHDDRYSRAPLRPIDRAKAVLLELYPNKVRMPGKLKAVVREVEDECRKRNWTPPSQDTVERAAEELGYRPPRKRPPRKRR